MTSKSTKKDYKALYNALKNEHNFVLKTSSNALNDALNRLKAKDAELAKADDTITSMFIDLFGYIPFRVLEKEYPSAYAKYYKETKGLDWFEGMLKEQDAKFSVEEAKLKEQEAKLKEQDAKLKEQDKQLAKYIIKNEKFCDFRGEDINDILDGYEGACKETDYYYNELEKYKEAEKAYKTKFGLEETRLTSQEMKEMERRAREEDDEDDDRPLVSKPKKSKPKKK
jgi:hypothetical protein